MTAPAGPGPACPRCGRPTSGPVEGGVDTEAEGWQECPADGPVPPLWRPASASYDALVAQLSVPGPPTYLPWPMGPGWTVSDLGWVGAVGAAGPRAQATMTGCSGASELDGSVDLLLVVEEPGVGLGTARAGLPGESPPPDLFDEAPQLRVRVSGLDVRLWAVPMPEDRETQVVPDSPGALFDPLADVGVDRSVLVGEAGGRWLWVMVRPASALLMLASEVILADAATLGPALVEVSCSGPPPRW